MNPIRYIKEIFTIPPRPKIALIVGHNARAPGAKLALLHPAPDVYEYQYNAAVCRMIHLGHPMDTKVFYKDDPVMLHNLWGYAPDLTYEFHYNAYDGTASGALALCLDEQNSPYWAHHWLTQFAADLKKRNRGVKTARNGVRGFKNLVEASLPSSVKASVLVEPFFGDNAADVISPQEYSDWWIQYISDLKANEQFAIMISQAAA